MDQIKNALSGNHSKEEKPSNSQSSGQNQDYGDKAFKAVNDKAGWGLKDSQRESITDFGRNAYEKATGKKVDPKYSN